MREIDRPRRSVGLHLVAYEDWAAHERFLRLIHHYLYKLSLLEDNDIVKICFEYIPFPPHACFADDSSQLLGQARRIRPRRPHAPVRRSCLPQSFVKGSRPAVRPGDAREVYVRGMDATGGSGIARAEERDRQADEDEARAG